MPPGQKTKTLNRTNIVTNSNNDFKNGKEIISALSSGLTEIGQSRIFRKVVVEDGPPQSPLIYIVLYGNRWVLHHTSSLT